MKLSIYLIAKYISQNSYATSNALYYKEEFENASILIFCLGKGHIAQWTPMFISV